jgi:putative membrane protein (TIGR04086 family)
MKLKILVTFAKGLFAAYVVSAVVILVLAFLMFQWDISEGVIRGGIIFTYVISNFVCGMFVSRKRSGRKWLWGMLGGVSYYLILLIVSMICNHVVAASIPGAAPVLFFCISGGMLGGMMQALR